MGSSNLKRSISKVFNIECNYVQETSNLNIARSNTDAFELANDVIFKNSFE